MTDPLLPVHVVVDVETTGLNENENVILELGIVLYSIEMQEISSFRRIVADGNTVAHLDHLAMLHAQERDHFGQEPWKGAAYVHEMHQKNGLAWEIRDAHAQGSQATPQAVAADAVGFLNAYGLGENRRKLPMTGSSVLLDRSFIKRQMPELDAAFHYRNTDVSSIKNLVEIYREDVRLDLQANPAARGGEHRVLSDCRNTAYELEFYLTWVFAKQGRSS